MTWRWVGVGFGAGLALAAVLGMSVPGLTVERTAPATTGAADSSDGHSFAARIILAIGKSVGVEAERVQLAQAAIPETIYIARMQDAACDERCKTIFFLETIGPNSIVGIFDLGRDYALTEVEQKLPGEEVARPAFRFDSGPDAVSIIYMRGGEMHERRFSAR